MSDRWLPTLQMHDGIAVWSGGHPQASIDIWFLHALGDSHHCFRDVFEHPISQRIRVFLFDLPGHGASPARSAGLTVEQAACIWRDLIVHFSLSRRVVLVGHSMASIIATCTARLLHDSPTLLISIEGNLTLADAYFSGQAARFDEPEAFHAWFQSKILEMAAHDEELRRYSCSLQFADPKTLWTLGRSVLAYPNPGDDFLSLRCPAIYYWDPASTTHESNVFLIKHSLRQRKLEGLGHWPMVKAPAQFYAAIEQDVFGTDC
jgi:pimeloyl-ACP methyl ester carboxylesterase